MARSARTGGIAALLIFLAFAVHWANILYFEPRMGFDSPLDYADLRKVAGGLSSLAWLWSGYAHLLTGFALLVLAVVAAHAFAPQRPVAARLLALTGALAALGFALTGVIDVPGRRVFWVVDAANPGNTAALVGGLVLARAAANNLALVLFGWFALQLTWCARRGGRLPFLAGLLGYLCGLAGLAVFAAPIASALAYALIPLWMLWLGVLLYRRADSIVVAEE